MALLLTLIGCGQPFPVDGVWLRGGISGDHFGLVALRLTQQGNQIAGTACYTEDGHLIYRDVPVSGQYPSVTYSVSFGGFVGEIVSDSEIQGQFSSGGGQDRGRSSARPWTRTRDAWVLLPDTLDGHVGSGDQPPPRFP
jgi:hypothetical protein